MAEYNDELAFLESMKGEPSYATESDNAAPAEIDAESADEDEDYDPSDFVPPATAALETEKPANTNGAQQNGGVTKQPRTRGGFVIDDDDDEEETESQDASAHGTDGLLNGAKISSELQRSSSGTPSNALSTPDANVPILKPETLPSKESIALNPSASALLSDSRANSSTPVPNASTTTPAVRPVEQPKPTSSSLPKVRLPQDRVGILEDRVKEDPRGDMEAWLELISEHRNRNRLDDARAVYDRFFKVFPSAAEQWASYAHMELENEDFWRVEQIFNKALLSIPNVQLWGMYLDYVRRRNNLTTDSTGTARQVISQAYEFVLANIGIDKDSGFIWQDYVKFIRSGPGNVGGSNWQDQQKMDTLRKAFRQAIMIPTQAVHALWQEYYAFEMGLNKVTGRKFLHEKMPSYMTAKQSFVQLQNITNNLNRTTLARLPPAVGFDGDVEHKEQVDIWRKWIQWEKDDNLVLKEEDLAAYKRRVLYVYKQATITMRFEPEFWYDAADFCINNDMETESKDFLEQGIAANPESCLLAFKRADRIEMSTAAEEGQDAVKRRGDAIREPYDNVLNALYELIAQVQAREEKAIARLQENFAMQEAKAEANDSDGDDDDAKAANAGEAALEAQIKALQSGNQAQIEVLKKTLSFAWIALMRAMRRVQGKGKPGDVIGGSRQIFSDARKTGRITSEVYVASALIEHHCYKDPAATKIFERGMKLFPEDENFALEYLKHLIDINDATNTRAVFEAIVNRLTQKSENVARAKPLYLFFHSYESKYGELSQIAKLEKRITDLFPEDPQLALFAHRYEHTNLQNQRFDPTTVRPIISLAVQARPKAMPSIEVPPSPVREPSVAPFSPKPQNSPRLGLAVADHQPYISPKRPFDGIDDMQSRKVPRGESPLKGAAGRRLDAAKRRAEAGGPQVAQVGPPSLPRDVTFFLSILPRADLSGHLPRPNIQGLMHILGGVNMRGGGQQAAGMQRQVSGQGYPGAPPSGQVYGPPGGQYTYPAR